MRSRTSLYRYIKSDIKNRLWLFILTALVMVFGQIGSALSLWDMFKMSGPGSLGDYRELFPQVINGSYYFLPLAAFFILGIVSGITGFAYLHRKEETDFYHSLPLKRGQLFAVNYFSGIVMHVIPFVIGSFITILIGQAAGLMDGQVFVQCLLGMIFGFLIFLIGYNTAVLAMMLTGRIVTAVLACGVLMLYARILRTVFGSLADVFFDTYCYMERGRSFLNYLDPTMFIYNLGGRLRWTALSDISWVIILGVQIVVALVSYMLYRHRRSEAAGNALAFYKSEGVIKFLIAVPASLTMGTLIASFFCNNVKAWTIGLSIVFVILLCLVIEFIYRPDVRKLMGNRGASIASCVVVVVIMLVFALDITGFDSYIPDEEKLENISMENWSASYFLGDAEFGDLTGSETEDSVMMVAGTERIGRCYENYEALYKLGQIGAENAQSGITVDETDKPGDYVILIYHLKNGHDRIRQYYLERDVILDAMDELLADADNKKIFYPVNGLDSSLISSIDLTDLNNNSEVLDIPAAEVLAAYRTDINSHSVRQLENEAPAGELYLYMKESDMRRFNEDIYVARGAAGIEYPEDTDVYIGRIYFYKDYAELIGLLSEYGYEAGRGIDAGRIDSLEHYISESEAVTVTDRDEIEELLGRIRYTNDTLLGGYYTEKYQESVSFDNNGSYCSFPLNE